MIELCSKEMCSGCAACANRCPRGAIGMLPDDGGFLRPAIDGTKCVECGLCQKACPVLCAPEFHPKARSPHACWAKDDAIRTTSSSGGLFSVFANRIIKEGGAVNGVAFDADFTLRHRIVETEEGVASLRGSKYVQASVGDIYREVERILKTGRMFLFTSTPCQVAGLLAYLGKKYDNLITCDFVCHGVPSPEKFKEYLTDVASAHGVRDVVDYAFRDLSGWGYAPSLRCRDGRKIPLSPRADTYFQSFINAREMRSSCYKCPHARPERVSDLTIGDFWGLPIGFQVRNDAEKGCSLLLINTEKGRDLVRSVSSGLVMHQRVWRDCRVNHQLFRPSTPRNGITTSFLFRAVRKICCRVPAALYTSLLKKFIGGRSCPESADKEIGNDTSN